MKELMKETVGAGMELELELESLWLTRTCAAEEDQQMVVEGAGDYRVFPFVEEFDSTMWLRMAA